MRKEKQKKQWNYISPVQKIKKGSKPEILKEIQKWEKRGYECAFPIQTLSGMKDSFDKHSSTFYFTIMKKVKE